MESDLLPTTDGIKGINLDNYFPNQRSYNSVVYYHKKFLKNTKEEKPLKTKTGDKTRKSKKKKINTKFDKTQQFNNETEKATRHNAEAEYYYNPVFHTLRFAKNLVPLVIPPVKDASSPIYYTIKTIKKKKKQEQKPRETSIENNATYSKDKMHRPDTENKRNTKPHRESYSVGESIDPSSQNTLDDLNLNINQSSSFSESTEVKYFKRGPTRVPDKTQKYFVSNSFDALATESINGESNKIKIHLMNDSDKAQFSNSIKNPIINAIKECLSQLSNNHEINTELKTVQRNIKSNNQKLDEVLERLACLEKRLKTAHQYTPRSEKREKTLRMVNEKASKLEELGEDITEVKESKLSDDDFSEEYNIQKRKLRYSGKSVVVAINEPLGREEKDKKAHGEEVPSNDGLEASSSISQQAIKPERPNRLPARFCWTDADRLK